MSGKITHSPAREHHCNAGWRVESDEEAAKREAQQDELPLGRSPQGMRMMIEDRPRAAEGSVWTCDQCGQEWKATYPYANVFAPSWVKKHKPWRRR